MKRFYGFRTTADYGKVKGVYPQVGVSLKDNSIEDHDIIRRVHYKPVATSRPFKFRLEKKTVFTDVLSQSFISSPGLLISQRMKELFQKFNLAGFEFVPVVVEDKNKIVHDYFWLHQVMDPLTNIDFGQTVFEVRELEGKVVSRFKVTSVKELASRTIRIVMMEIMPENNILRLKSPGYEADMITLDIISRKTIFVEERLARRLEEAGYTGYDVTSTVLEIL